MRRRRRALPCIVALACSLVLAGCVGGSHDAAVPTSTPSASQTGAPTRTVRPTAAATDIATLPGSTAGAVVAPDDNTGTRCASDGDRRAVSGTITNPDTATHDYRVYVSLIDDATVVQVGEVDLPGVRAGRSVAWAMTLPDDGADVSCLLRVERAPAS